MTFCREFHCLPEPGAYLDQPADEMMRWHQILTVEHEVAETKRRIDEARAAHARKA